MMRYQHVLLLCALSGVVLNGCKKDRENEAPHITITSPADGFSLTVPDTLVVTVQASDDIALEQISVSLLDQNNIPVVDAVGTSVSGTSATVTLGLPILSEQLESGDYKLFATASDGSLSGKDVRTLHVTAVPLRLRALFTATAPSAGTVALYKTDSLGQTALATSWPMDLGGTAISSAAQRLCVAGGSSGDLRVFSPDNPGIIWQRPNLSSIGAPWFTSVDLCADGRFYVGQDDGTLRGFTASNGTGTMNAALPAQFRVEQSITSGELVVTTERHFVTQEQRMGTYFKASGSLVSSQPLGLTPVRIFERIADFVLIFGNQGGQGHVLDRNLPGGGGWEPYTWPSTITAVEQIGSGTWLVALANGDLQRFTYSDAGSLSIGTTPVLSTLVKDKVSGAIYGGADGHVLILDPSNGAILGDIPVGGQVLKVLPLFNR
ncbi:MAG: hypothetical protein IPL81_04060 [Flavobacteriales bacterium]|nr:hypothetical protein [Flavobacteriales bacterium]